MFSDLRYAIRMLLKNAGFTTVALLTLALGIGANTAIFSVVNAVLLRPLPYPESHRLVRLQSINLAKAVAADGISLPDFRDWQEQNHVFEQVAAFNPGSTLLRTPEGAERLLATGITPGFFEVLGVPPFLGQTSLGKDQQAKSSGAVLGYGLWQRQFAAHPNILGKTLNLVLGPAVVAGVMPPGFSYPPGNGIWLLTEKLDLERDDRTFWQAIARLKPGVSLETASVEMSTIAHRLAQEYPKTNRGWDIRVVPLQELAVGPIRPALLILMAAAGMVLLICCINIANLLLARGLSRRKEIAVRVALGAGKPRMIRQLLTESLLLACLGGSLGLALAFGGARLLASLVPDALPRINETSVDLPVLTFTLALSLVSCILFGLLPALRAGGVDAQEVLKDSAHSLTGGMRLRRWTHLLVIGEFAASLVLIIASGLLMKSFVRVLKSDLGFQPENLLTMRIALYSLQDSQRSSFIEEIMARIRGLAGVKSVAGALTLPLNERQYTFNRAFVVEGRPLAPEQEDFALYKAVTPEYFQTMGIPLLQGRQFTDRDTKGSPEVIIVNQTLARRYWPQGDAVGKKLTMWRDEKLSKQIVGVIGDVKSYSRDLPVEPEIYVPYLQDPWPGITLVIRTGTDPLSFLTAVRRQVRAVGTDQPLYNIRSMEQILSGSISQRRFHLLLIGAFSVLALILAAVGIYGVITYSVAQRTHEIGIRMALGASQRDVLKLVVREGMVVATTGLVIGLAGAFALTRLMSGLLFAVAPTDSATFALASFLLTALALLACYIPARRATKVDPMVALRYE